MARAPLVLVVSASAPYKDPECADRSGQGQAQEHPHAYLRPGPALHLAVALLEQAAGIQLQDVPYRGSSQSLIAPLGGEIQLGIDTVAAAACR